MSEQFEDTCLELLVNIKKLLIEQNEILKKSDADVAQLKEILLKKLGELGYEP